MSRQYTVPLNKIYPAVPTSRTSFNTAFEWDKHFSDNDSDDSSVNADEGNRSNGNALNARDTNDSAHKVHITLLSLIPRVMISPTKTLDLHEFVVLLNGQEVEHTK